jgi:hypothetical protein
MIHYAQWGIKLCAMLPSVHWGESSQNHQFGSWVICTECKAWEDTWLQQQLQMVTAWPGSAFGHRGPQSCSQCMDWSHFWCHSLFGPRSLQSGARQGVMVSLNFLDCPCEVIHPSPQSSLDTSTANMRLPFCVVLAGYSLGTLGLFSLCGEGALRCSEYSLLFL